MAKGKLESFKIGDTQKPKVKGSPKKSAPAKPSSEASSLGFQRIEGILESQEPAAITANLNKIHDNLEEFEKESKTQRDKAAAKKALAAVERTADLLDYLFQTKAAMARPAETPTK